MYEMRSNLRRTASTRSEIQFRVRHSIPDFGDIDPFEVMRATKKRSNAYQIGQRYGSKITSGIYSFTRHPLDTISRIFSNATRPFNSTPAPHTPSISRKSSFSSLYSPQPSLPVYRQHPSYPTPISRETTFRAPAFQPLSTPLPSSRRSSSREATHRHVVRREAPTMAAMVHQAASADRDKRYAKVEEQRQARREEKTEVRGQAPTVASVNHHTTVNLSTTTTTTTEKSQVKAEETQRARCEEKMEVRGQEPTVASINRHTTVNLSTTTTEKLQLKAEEAQRARREEKTEVRAQAPTVATQHTTVNPEQLRVKVEEKKEEQTKLDEKKEVRSRAPTMAAMAHQTTVDRERRHVKVEERKETVKDAEVKQRQATAEEKKQHTASPIVENPPSDAPDGLLDRDSFLTEWKTDAYLQDFYTKVDDPAMQLMLTFMPNLAVKLPHCKSLLDYGAGPTIHLSVVFRNLVDEIYFADYLPSNRDELQRWVNRTSKFNWSAAVKMIALREGCSKFQELDKMESVAREKVRGIFHCDCLKDPPLDAPAKLMGTFEIVTTVFTVEYCCNTREEYRNAIRRIVSLVKPGGYFIMGGILEETWCGFGGRHFTCLYITEEFMKDCVRQAGCLVDDERKTSFYEVNGMFIICSQKDPTARSG